MKILLIEDDEIKIIEIEKVLAEIFNMQDVTICKSLTSGIKKIRTEIFELLILDMSLPLYDDTYNKEDFETFAGIDILRELDRKEIEINVIVITAFDILGENELTLQQLDSEIKEEFNNIYKGIIHYENSSTKWIVELKKIIKQMES